MRYLTISEVSDFLNVSIVTLRRWSKSGKLVESFRSVGGHRRYSSAELELFLGMSLCHLRVEIEDGFCVSTCGELAVYHFLVSAFLQCFVSNGQFERNHK